MENWLRWHDKYLARTQLNVALKRRSLLQADTSEAPAPAPPTGPPLTLPKNALEVCSFEKQREATRCKNVVDMYIEQEGADEECCKLLSSYYSDASTKDTRNCLCDPEVWARELALEAKNFIPFGSIADSCVAANYTVGKEAVAYYMDGGGPCAGMAAGAVEEEEKGGKEEVLPPPARSFGTWVREGLPDNPWVLFCFIVSIFSVIGFLIILWPFVFHFVWTLIELPAKLKAKKAL